jgi:hypothetical protein
MTGVDSDLERVTNCYWNIKPVTDPGLQWGVQVVTGI